MAGFSGLTDAELIEQAQQGNTEAFGALYERYAQTVFRYIYSHLNNQLDAEDMTEEVFFRVWQSLHRYREQGVPLLAYLFRVARNTIIDHYRRAKNKEIQFPPELDLTPDTLPGPSEVVGARLEHQEIRQIMEKLHPEYREVLLLRFLSDLSPDETAQAMGKSEGAIRVLQHRALAALRKTLRLE